MKIGFQKTVESGYVFIPQVTTSGEYYEFNVVSLDVSLPGPVSSYASVDATVLVDGRADDGFKFYLNDQVFHAETGDGLSAGRCFSDCRIIDNWYRRQVTKKVNLTSQRNILKIVAFDAGAPLRFAQVWNAKITITAMGR